jgi:hypothetical protein
MTSKLRNTLALLGLTHLQKRIFILSHIYTGDLSRWKRKNCCDQAGNMMHLGNIYPVWRLNKIGPALHNNM